MIRYEYQNIKTFLQKVTFQIGLEKFLRLKSVPWTYVISDINDEEIVETFYEKELPKKIKNGLELKK